MLLCKPCAFVFILGAAMLLSASQSPSQPFPLYIEIVNIQPNSGKIVVAIYNAKSSWLKSPFQTITLSTNASAKTATFEVLPGQYAVSIYQDINENGQLDQSFLGIPKEPIGFGNNYRPFGKPKFESALIEHNPASKPKAIKLFSVL